MENWVFFSIVSLCIASFIKSLHDFFFPKLKLPPGPATFPFIGNLVWLRRSFSFSDLEPILRQLHAKYGPIVTLRFGPRLAIFISDNSLAYKALVQNGAVFADRTPAPTTSTSRILNISSCPYGPTWRLLRRNLTAEILHPSRVRIYSSARKSALEILVSRLRFHSGRSSAVRVMDHFHYAMFNLLVSMCFGENLEENQIREIETIQRKLILGFRRFNSLNLFPRLGKMLFQKRWEELINFRKDQAAIFLPHIRARQQLKLETQKRTSSCAGSAPPGGEEEA